MGSWVALGFVWVSFPSATSVGFSVSKLIAGAEMSDPRGYPHEQPDKHPDNRSARKTMDLGGGSGSEIRTKYGR